jgi:hypothetical protein
MSNTEPCTRKILCVIFYIAFVIISVSSLFQHTHIYHISPCKRSDNVLTNTSICLKFYIYIYIYICLVR